MTAALVVVGWCVAAVLALELGRRARLLVDAAHELRGPLTAISLGLEALRRQPAARRRVEALAVELGRMEMAVADVGAAARGRRAAGRAAPVVVRELVERCAEAWRPAAERAGGRVVIDWPAGSDRVEGDRRRLAQAFGNLLANAVEHGGGDLVVRGRPVDGVLRIEVEDRGSALARAAGRGARRGRWRAGARGRGLAIAARGLEQAGGRLESTRTREGGRIAAAELPLERAP